MIEEAKIEAQKYYLKLDKYPLLNKKLTQRKGRYINAN